MFPVFYIFLVQCYLAQAILPGYDTPEDAGKILEEKINSMTESHLNLRNYLGDIKKTIIQVEEEGFSKIQNYFLPDQQPSAVCDAAVEPFIQSAEEGAKCLADVALSGLLKQAKTQLHCIRTWFECVMRMTQLAQKVTIGCGGDPSCITEAVTSAVKEETFAQDQVVQITTHATALIKTVKGALFDCQHDFVKRSADALSMCSSRKKRQSNIDSFESTSTEESTSNQLPNNFEPSPKFPPHVRPYPLRPRYYPSGGPPPSFASTSFGRPVCGGFPRHPPPSFPSFPSSPPPPPPPQFDSNGSNNGTEVTPQSLPAFYPGSTTTARSSTTTTTTTTSTTDGDVMRV